MAAQRLIQSVVAAALLAAPALAGPRAVVPAPEHNFDIVAKGEVIKHAFEIRNEGDEPLEISEVKPACGCTVARFDPMIAPGATGKVYADVDTLSFNGPIAKSVYVYTNDPKAPRIDLVVKADVRPYVGIDPGYARFSYVQGEQTGTISQTVWAPDGRDLEILGVDNPYDHITVSYRPATDAERVGDKPGKQWRVDVTILADAPVGALRDYIVLKVDHPKQKKVQIPVSGFVRPRQHATPQVADFGEIKRADLPYERAVAFTSFIAKPIEAPEVETGLDGLEVEVRELQEGGHRFQLLLRLTPDLATGAFETTIKLQLTDPQNPLYEIPVKGRLE